MRSENADVGATIIANDVAYQLRLASPADCGYSASHPQSTSGQYSNNVQVRPIRG